MAGPGSLWGAGPCAPALRRPRPEPQGALWPAEQPGHPVRSFPKISRTPVVTVESEEDRVLEASRALKIHPQIHCLARSARDRRGITSQGGYAERVCFQEKRICLGVDSELLKASPAL